jgi:hypothetical protein
MNKIIAQNRGRVKSIIALFSYSVSEIISFPSPLNNITGHPNPIVVNSDINSPQFLTFSAFEGRAFTSRIRLLGKK